MKKFYFFIMISIFASLIFVSCVDNTYNLALNNISEIRNQILTFRNEELYITFMTGQREKNYKLDGIANEMIDFAIINLYFENKDYQFNELKISYSLTVNNKDYSGNMINNPYDNSFVVDLGIPIEALNNIDISITMNETTNIYTLDNISQNWPYNHKTALETVCKDLRDYLKQEISDNKLNAEVIIKIAYNNDIDNKYYWYIQIISSNGNTYSELIDPHTNEIIAKNIS